MIPEHKFIFICGLHRSGTSTLYKLLRDQELISGFANTGVPEDEGQHLQSVFLPAIAFDGPGKFGFNDGVAMTDKHPLATEQNRQKLLQEWSRHWDLSKPLLLEKSPPNILRTRFLQAMFPNARFIVLIRHPVPVSYATMKWLKSSLSELFHHWITVHEIFEQDKSHLNHLCMVSYEQLVEDTSATLTRLEDFLSIPLRTTNTFSDHNKRYFDKWTTPGIMNSIRRQKLIAQFESQFSHFGYSLRDTRMFPVF